MLARTVAAVTLAILSTAAPHSSAKQLTPDDAAVIAVALTAASLTRLVEFFKGADIPTLLLRSQTAAVCQGDSKPGTFCVDAYARTLQKHLAGKQTFWPTVFYDAAVEQNRLPRDLSGLHFAAATLTAPDSVGASKEGKALAQVSMPTYLGDRAIVFVWTSYAWSITHAVLIEKRAGKWEPVGVEVLGRS